jgi:hypothetical protein
VTIVATILTSSLVSTIVSNFWSVIKERKQFFRTKLEELFTAYRGYTGLIATAVWHPWWLVMRKAMTYEEADAFQKRAFKDQPHYEENCEATIRLYFDEFLPAWEALRKQCDELMLIYAKFTEGRHAGEDLEQFAGPYESAYREFQRQEELLQNALIAKVRKLMPPP